MNSKSVLWIILKILSFRIYLFLLTLFLFIYNGSLQAQWVQVGLNNQTISCFAISGNNVYADAGSGMYRSTNNGTTWTLANAGLPTNAVISMVVSGSYIFAGTYGGGVFLSTNNGTNWTPSNNGITSNYITALTSSGHNIFAGIDGGVYLSTNSGTNWTQVNNGLTNTNVHALASIGTNIFVGISGEVFRSTNNGAEWNSANNGMSGSEVNALAVSGNNIYVGTGAFVGTGIFLSTNYGANWSAVNNGLYNSYVPFLSANGTYILAGTEGGVYYSTNNGSLWNLASYGLPNLSVTTLAVGDSLAFLGNYFTGVWRRPLSDLYTPVELESFAANTHNGIVNLNWTTATELNNKGFEIQRKLFSDDYNTIDFVKGYGTSTKTNNYSWSDKPLPGTYSYRLKQIDYNGKYEYSKEVEITITPNIFSLEQNFPNPFNPSTVISYSLPSASYVNLIIYNTLGQIVKVLENGSKNAGNYSVNFNASDLASGIYFYKLEAGQFSQVKKMALLK